MKIATLCYIRNDKNQTLMMHRVKKLHDMHEGKWNGLGGKFEIDETPEECVIREIYEESGLTLITPTLKGIITFPAFDGIETWMVFVFTANKFEGELIESNEGNLKWIDNDKLFDLNLWDGDKIFMTWLDKKEFFSAKFIYNKGKLVSHIVNFY